jgi:flagellar protein FlbT
MALKVELKPGEKILIGETVITNGDQRARFLVEGTTAILREKDIMTRVTANSPAKRLYLAVQLMYTSRDPRHHHETYFELMRDLVQAAPSTWAYIENINNHILTGQMYKALKEAKKLIAYEEGLIRHAAGRQGLRQNRDADRQRA